MLKNIELSVGEKTVVYEKAIVVFGKAEKRIYNLNGKLIGKSQGKGDEINLKDFCIFFDKCLVIREDTYWKIFDYEGNVIYDQKTLKIEKCFHNEKWLRFIERKEMGQDFIGAIYSENGECILPYGEHKNVVIFRETVFANKRIYDAKSKKYIGDKWDSIYHFGGYSIAKSNGKYYVYNHYTRALEMSIDAYTYGSDLSLLKVYKNNFCGLMQVRNTSYYSESEIKYKSKEYLVLPIVYKKIVFYGDDIFAYSQEGIKEKYERKQLIGRKDENKKNIVEKKKSEKLTEVEVFEGVSLKERDTIERYEKFFLVQKITDKDHDKKITEYFYYDLNGKFIGKSGWLELSGDYEGMLVPNFLATSKWLALGGNEVESYFGRTYFAEFGWTFYKYDGSKVFDFIIERLEKREGYYVLKIKDKSESIICDQDGNILFSIKGEYKLIELSESKRYFIAHIKESSNNQRKFVIYNLEGKRIFERKFEYSRRKKFVEDIIFYEDEESGKFIEYDVKTGRIVRTEIDEVDEIELINSDKKMYLFESNEKLGLYEYTSERCDRDKFVGFREIIPMQYDDIIDGVECICAESGDGEDIYGYSGDLICTTRS